MPTHLSLHLGRIDLVAMWLAEGGQKDTRRVDTAKKERSNEADMRLKSRSDEQRKGEEKQHSREGSTYYAVEGLDHRVGPIILGHWGGIGPLLTVLVQDIVHRVLKDLVSGQRLNIPGPLWRERAILHLYPLLTRTERGAGVNSRRKSSLSANEGG
ncbi:hypothetical protein NDU88_004096 [Pleurodeles waltl]|uniref:Uncharacterized protein n=1 Tax=Pleurodeles waltl TaxID=8319 RepID=A0AAV7V0B5_PLEWA|nr:hypothetical protein NDU88_004096 [Pleurodeles waltl]